MDERRVLWSCISMIENQKRNEILCYLVSVSLVPCMMSDNASAMHCINICMYVLIQFLLTLASLP
jgi:hypothetical protein